MNQELADLLQQEVAKLNPSPVIELYELDTRPCGDDGDLLFFHNGTGGYAVPITFLGNTYTSLPIIVRGFELSGSGEPARPTLSILNAGGFMSAAVLKMQDLIGAIVTRRRTFARFLDTEETAAPVQYPPDIFKIVQKTREDRLLVEFELGSGLDLDGVRFPARQVVSTYCQHVYRGAGCRFAGNYTVAGTNNTTAPGILRFRNYWDQTETYTRDDSVLFNTGSEEGLYICIITQGTSISGADASPLVSASWQRAQRFRGEFVPTVSNYLTNDVVYVNNGVGRQYYIAIRSVPISVRPPNKLFWHFDECGKSLNHCRWRWDPLKTNRNPLPFGAFPGTISIPEA